MPMFLSRMINSRSQTARQAERFAADLRSAAEQPFVMRDRFLSEHESLLLRTLTQAVAGQAVICPKVRVADVLAVLDASDNMEDAIAIDRKSVSFLLCDIDDMKPIAAISVLQSRVRIGSHVGGVVERAFCAAGIPVVFVSPNECTVQDLKAQLAKILRTAEPSRSSVAGATNPGERQAAEPALGRRGPSAPQHRPQPAPA